MNEELVISLSDIRYVSLSCPNCHTRLVMDMLDDDFKNRPNSFVPGRCPGCGAEYDTALRSGLDDLREAFRDLQLVADRVRFRKLSE